MTDKGVTLFSVHLGDGDVQIGPKSMDIPRIRGGDDAGDETERSGRSCPCPMCDDGCNCRGCQGGKLLLRVGLFAVLAAIVWKLLGDADLGAAEDLDDLTR